MRRGGAMQSLAASPTMVGAVTTLIVIVAVFLAYNANNGLPFVPVYRVSVEVPNAARLTDNNEVRIGGHRVGVVESIEPVQAEDTQTTAATGATEGQGGTGGVVARLNLKLDKSAEPLSQDSIFRVRYRSSFGLKYLEIVRGTGPAAPEGFVFDGTDDSGECRLPVDPKTFASTEPRSAMNGCFQPQTEFDDIADTFDRPTRTNSRTNLVGYGDAVAGRGTSLNDAIASLKPLFRNLGPVAQALAEPSTRFERFFPALGRTAAIVAPVAEEQAQLFTNMAVAFDAISRDPGALEESISEGPATLATGIRVLPAQQGFLADLTRLSRALAPGAADLRITLPTLNEAVLTGTPVLERTPAMNDRLRRVMVALRGVLRQPTTRTSLQRLGETFNQAEPLARFVVPAQTTCNLWNYWFTYLPNALSDHDQVGWDFRQALANFPQGATTLSLAGAFPSPPFPPSVTVQVPGEVSTPVAGYSGLRSNGRAYDPSDPVGGTFKPYELPILNGVGLYAHHGERGDGDCEPGQTGYMPALGADPVAGQAVSNPAHIASHIEGSQGPTTLYWHKNSTRELRDTRVPSRQPGSWRRIR
jgi:ABC-type transporter Mla subunit MlaD